MTEVPTKDDEMVERRWRDYLTHGHSFLAKRTRGILGRLPSEPRCKSCGSPFSGAGGLVVRLTIGLRQSTMNPRFCNFCEDILKKHLGGAEVEVTLLFADVRGSTTLAEKIGAWEFSRLINRFFKAATQVLIRSDALIDKLIGDEVVAMYVPGFAGPQYIRRAVEAGQEILNVTGHREAGGPWIPVGVGLHHGVAFVGVVGSSDGVVDITALGDVPNTAARLASNAGIGEVIVSEETLRAAGLDGGSYEKRHLTLKGRSEAVDVRVIKVGTV